MTDNVLTQREHEPAHTTETRESAIRAAIAILRAGQSDRAAVAVEELRAERDALRADRDRFRDLYRDADRTSRAAAFMEDERRVADLRSEHQAMTAELHLLRAQRADAIAALEAVIGALRAKP